MAHLMVPQDGGDDVGTVKSRASRAPAAPSFGAREVASKELEAAVGELFLFSNLLSLTRGAAGVAASTAASAQPVLFETAVAVRDSEPQRLDEAERRALLVAKRTALKETAEELQDLGHRLSAKVATHRLELAALHLVSRSGWVLYTEARANEVAHTFASVVAAARPSAAPALRAASVVHVPLPAHGDSGSSRVRLVPRAPHVLCLPTAWREAGSGGAMQAGRALRPRMLAPLVMDEAEGGYKLGLPAGHADSRVVVSVGGNVVGGGGARSAATRVVRLPTADATDEEGAPGARLLAACSRVAEGVCFELLWDALTRDGLALASALQAPANGNTVRVRVPDSGGSEPDAAGSKRRRDEGSGGGAGVPTVVTVLSVSLTSTDLVLNVALGGGAGEGVTLAIRMRHEQELGQEKEAAEGSGGGTAVDACAAALSSMAAQGVRGPAGRLLTGEAQRGGDDGLHGGPLSALLAVLSASVHS